MPEQHERDQHSRDSWSRWLWTWSAVQTPLVCLGILDWGPATVLAVAAVGVVIGLLVAVTWASAVPEAAGARLTTLPIVPLATCTGLGAVALPLLGRGPGVIFACVVAVAVLTSPVRTHRRGSAQEQPTPPERPAEVVEPPAAPADTSSPDVEVMTDEQLCTAWRHSFRTLETARSVPETAGVVTLRQVLLDELETRNAPGLRAWLASGARAASGPDRFLRGPVPLHRHLPAWPPNQAPAGD